MTSLLLHKSPLRVYHFRFLLLFPGDKSGNLEDLALQPTEPGENMRGQNQSPKPTVENLYA